MGNNINNRRAVSGITIKKTQRYASTQYVSTKMSPCIVLVFRTYCPFSNVTATILTCNREGGVAPPGLTPRIAIADLSSSDRPALQLLGSLHGSLNYTCLFRFLTCPT